MLPSIPYKSLQDCLKYPLCIIFNVSMLCGVLPLVWKQADVIPVYKKGSPSDPSNYRPISLTCVACKLMEKGIKCDVLDFMLVNKLLTKKQHGFLSKRSTATQLLECTRV